MEVGPLSRMLVGYASGRTDIQDVVNDTLGKLGVPITALFSTLGRTAARGLETLLIAHWNKEYFDRLVNNIKSGQTSTFTREKWEPSTWPKEAQGLGLTEAPRGALAHYIRIADGKIANYQMVVPTTWNASPRDPMGQMSSYEAALIGTPVGDEDQPLEIIRTIHSFDPCLACAVHLYDPEGKHLHEIRVG
jgi:hydrogenase large subunit